MKESDVIDRLTNLPNLEGFTKRGRDMLRLSDGSNGIALHVIQVCNLKSVIMEHGLHVGEEAFKAAGRRLYGIFDENKAFARLEGELFGLLQQGIVHNGHALYTARRVLESLEEPVVFNGREIMVRARIGIALYPQHGRGWDALFSHALEALLSIDRDQEMISAIYEKV